MVYLKETNFKNHLISNAKGDWFVKGKIYKRSDILKKDGSSRHSNLPLIGTKIKDFKGKEVVNFSVYENENNKISVKLLNDNSSWETAYSSRHGGSWDKVFYDICSWSNECYERVSWKDIHSDFTSESRQKWEDKGFDYEQCKKWISRGLKIDDYDFASYLNQRDDDFSSIDMEKLRKEYNANQQFEQNYPKATRNQVTELNISNKNLEGELDLSDFINLEKLDCAFNKLTKLNLKGLKNLWHIDAGLNMIEDLDSIIDSLDPEKLLVLKVHNNNLPEQDLSKFERFIKLETLLVGNFYGWGVGEKNITEGKYNRFYGSLEPLKNMSNLKELGIYGTDINSGLEFLPESVEELLTDSGKRYSNSPPKKVNEIREQLVPYKHDFKKWRKRVKNILLIGRSGRGKSTLANVITGEENKFAESSGSVSKTKKIQSEQFTDENNDYLVIDTPGIGDTRMSDNEVLDIIGEAVYLVKNGLEQVLFVVDGRFDQYEMATYNLLRTIIFDEKITNHTTVVRTNFADFRNKESRENDITSMKKTARKKKAELEKKIVDKEKEKNKLEEEKIDQVSEKYKKVTVEIENLNKELKSTLSEIIESCKSRVIHVDNPPSNKKLREKSRRRILDQLQKTCQTTSYKPDKLKELSDEISDDMDKLLQSRKELESEMKKLRSSSVSSLNNSPLLKTTTNITKPVASSENATAIPLEIPEFTTESHDITIAIGKIKELEDKKAKLRKEIAEKERIIRQKVLKHIYKNYQEISSELGGDILMQSVVGEHNWEKISPEFKDKGLILKWLNEKFDFEGTQKWAMALEGSFKPKEDTGFCAWLRDDMRLSVEKVKELDYPRDIEELRKGYAEYLEKEVKVLDEHSKKLGKKYILTPENFQKLIQLTCSVEVAQAFQATGQVLQAASQNQTVIQAWQTVIQAWQTVIQAFQTQGQTEAQAWAQAYQAACQAFQTEAQAEAQAWQTVIQDQAEAQVWVQAFQASTQGFQAASQAWQTVIQAFQTQDQSTPQVWVQAFQASAQGFQAAGQAFQAAGQGQAEVQTFQAEVQTFQASAQAWQAEAQAWQTVIQDQVTAQSVVQAFQASAQAWQTASQAFQAEAQAWQARAQHFKINLTLENIEKLFIEVEKKPEEGKVEISIAIENKPKN